MGNTGKDDNDGSSRDLAAATNAGTRSMKKGVGREGIVAWSHGTDVGKFGVGCS